MSISGEISTILGNVSSLNSGLTTIIARESAVKNITEQELTRLNAKKTEVDDAYTTNKRFVDLNDSYRKKQSQYNYLMFVVISYFVVMLILMQIQKAVPVIGGLLTVVTVILGIPVFIYVVYILIDINRRDPTDFDKILYNPPKEAKSSGTTATTSTSLNAGSIYTTYGGNVCLSGHSYDSYSGKCIPDCKDGKITNMADTGLYKENNITKGLDYTKFNVTVFDGINTCIDRVVCTGNNKVCGNFCVPKDYPCKESFEGINLVKKDIITSPNSPNEFSNYSRV